MASPATSMRVEVLHSTRPNLDGDQAQKQQIEDLEKRITKSRSEYPLTFVIAFSAVVSAFVAGLQWHTMDRQLDEMRDSSTQADRMLKSTEQLAKTAVDALALSREQFVQANRPLIIPVVQPSRGLVGEPVQAQMTLINYGKTVALNTVTRGAVFMGAKAMIDADAWFSPFEIPKGKSPVGSPIPPGIPTQINREQFVRFKTERNMEITDGKLIADRDGIVVIVARIQYQSTTGDTHHTDACYALSNRWEATLCPTHNVVD